MLLENGLAGASSGEGETPNAVGSIGETVLVPALCRGPEDQPPDEDPKGEMEGAGGSEEGAPGLADGDEADRGLGNAEAECEDGDEGRGGVAERPPVAEEETPLRSSSSGMRRWAWMSLRRPSSRWKRCSCL